MMANNGSDGKRKMMVLDQPEPQQRQQQPQILRVRRRRGDTEPAAANALRMVGAAVADAAPSLTTQQRALDTLLANWNVVDDEVVKAPSPATVLYERVGPSRTTTNKRRKDDILDAHLLEEDDEPGKDDDQEERTTTRTKKRRKLQIVHDGIAPNRYSIVGVEYPTLTPAQNRVNGSLLTVFQGERSLMEHVVFLQTTFADDDGDDHHHDFHSSPAWKVWLNWCCSPGGTILHAAALWDQTELLQTLLQQHNGGDDTVAEILHTLDEEGRSALEVARLSCHESMIIFLEELESQSEFVYDLYEFRPHTIDTSSVGDSHDGALTILDCELLRHNATYNASQVNDSDLLEYTGNNNHNFADDENDDDDDDGDDDSNNEDFFTNDYPDEDSSLDDGNNFRDYEGDDGGFDPAYGGIYGQRQQEDEYD